MGAQLASDSNGRVGYTLSVYTVLINPETEGHSRHQFQGSNCTAGDTTIQVGMTALECNDHRCILDACLNATDGAAATLGGLDHLDRVHVHGQTGESDGGVDGHGRLVELKSV